MKRPELSHGIMQYRVIKINEVKSTYLVSKHLRISLNFFCLKHFCISRDLVSKHLRISLKKFCLKHFCISRDTNEIMLNVIKQCLQAVHHSCRRSYASGHTKTSQ